MLLRGYEKEISRPECNSSFSSLHCIAHLSDDISEVLPYLNAELGGHIYTKEPPSVTFRVHGRLITLHARKIAINALESEEQADGILRWLMEEINGVWERRAGITPSFRSAETPGLLGILRLLPRTNCRECGEPTCTAFAALIVEGARGPDGCTGLSAEGQGELGAYLSGFSA